MSNSLFTNEDILTKEEIESWKSFVVACLQKKIDNYLKYAKWLLQVYAAAINAKGQPFPHESLIMTLLLSQHKIIISFSINGLQKIPKYFIPLKNLACCCHCNYSISKNTLWNFQHRPSYIKSLIQTIFQKYVLNNNKIFS